MDRHHPALVLALAATTTLAGCVGSQGALLGQLAGGDGLVLGPQEAPGWEKGQWWAFRATFPEANVTLDVALIVDGARDGGYALGTNQSSGFFGLPFAGNVTGELNPEVAGQTWRMFDFPLAGGKEWSQELFGHTASTHAREAALSLPGDGKGAGFVLEATAYGSRFARYTYSPDVGWLTELTIWDPGTGDTLLHAELLGWGDHYDEDYYVTVPVRVHEARYPTALPGEDTFQVPRGFQRLTAVVTASGTAGEFTGRLLDPHGREAAEATVHVTGFRSDQRELAAHSGTWTFEHTGAGKGLVRVEVYGVKRADAPPTGAAGAGDGLFGDAAAAAAALLG